MAVSSYLATLYFICGVIIFFLAVTILRYSGRDVVSWSTALVLFFAGFGPMLGALGVFLEQNLREGAYLFENLVGSFDYTWEFFFPSLVLFSLVHPRRYKMWKYIKRYMFILFLPHLFHLLMLIFLLDRVNPARVFNPLFSLSASAGVLRTMIESAAKFMNVFMELLFKAHTQLFSFVNISYAGVSLLLLGISMRGDLTPRVRRQMKIVVGGLGLCIVTYSLARIIPVFMRIEQVENVTIAFINASLIVGGGSIAYAIVRYQFLDLRLIARKGIFYGAAVAIFASIYLIIVKQIASYFYQFSGTRVEILETGLIVLFIILFQPVLGKMEEWIDKLLVREEKKPRVRLRELSGELLSMIDVESMKERIKSVLSSVFVSDEVDLVFAGEIFSEAGEDPYTEQVVKVLSHVGEPIKRLDFMEVMGFLNVRGRFFLPPGRKVIDEAVETLPGVVRRFARFDLIVPVIQDDRCEAVLLLGRRREHSRYSMEEQALLSMLASQVAAALSRIDLLKEVVEKKVIEEELNIARTIQLNLLPSSPPSLNGYEASAMSVSSKQVGGDYYDFIHQDSYLAFTVADVSGKGVPASLLMASLQASLRSMMDFMRDPIGVVGRLNNVMYDITAPDKFATLFYGCLDLKKHEVIYTNAGHFFPVVIRKGGRLDVLDYSGLILGVQPGFPYENRKLKMKPGDTLVVTTDGVTEAENISGNLFGEERLYPLLSSLRGRNADDVKGTIIEKVNAFSHPMGSRDDLTILVLRRKE